jgi:predicted ATPase with chaperone activity
VELKTSSPITRHPFAPRPRNIQETGLPQEFIENLALKHLYVNGTADLQTLSGNMALSGTILEIVLEVLRKTNKIEILAATHSSKGTRYALTDKGQMEAGSLLNKSGYAGPAPVPIEQYRKVVRAQSVHDCKITRDDVQHAFSDTTVNPHLLDQLGPAMHSGRAIMIYGLPGTGKTFICKRLTRLLGESIFIPYAVSVGESVIQFYDPVIHKLLKENDDSPSLHLHQGYDPRFVRCYRPVAISGGELTLDMLEIDHDRNTHLSQAPLQWKANNGMYIIDDLGRQKVPVVDLFNRWIVPLEEKHDYLTLDTGKRFSVPFDVILLFSANINPTDLADDAFLRRIGYKIKFAPVSAQEYQEIWHLYQSEFKINCPDSVYAELLERYNTEQRPLLPCHPRDLLGLISDQCQYAGDLSREATSARLHQAWDTYFINLDNERVDQ